MHLAKSQLWNAATHLGMSIRLWPVPLGICHLNHKPGTYIHKPLAHKLWSWSLVTMLGTPTSTQLGSNNRWAALSPGRPWFVVGRATIHAVNRSTHSKYQSHASPSNQCSASKMYPNTHMLKICLGPVQMDLISRKRTSGVHKLGIPSFPFANRLATAWAVALCCFQVTRREKFSGTRSSSS